MSIIFDYIRAPDSRTAIKRGKKQGDHRVGLDGIDPRVVLGQLVAAANGTRYHVDIVRTSGFPAEQLDDGTRDTLAGIDDSWFGELARRWSRIEQFGPGDTPQSLEPVVAQMVALARRARATGEHIYCRCSM